MVKKKKTTKRRLSQSRKNIARRNKYQMKKLWEEKIGLID